MLPIRPVSAFVFATVTAAGFAFAQAPVTQTVALTNVAVVDVDSGRVRAGQTVVVSGRRIAAVGPNRAVKIPQTARIIDATGKYVIPGLWDMHVHVWGQPERFYPLFIANGVTGVRQMSEPGNGLDSLLVWRREILNGMRVGPRIVGTGGTIFSSAPPGEITVKTVEEGRRVVDSLKAAGADFVKFHEDRMSREIYFAIAAEARRLGIPLVGHLPNTITEIEASDSGQVTVEHFNEVHCWWPAGAWPPSSFPLPDSTALQSCGEVARTFRRNGTWFVPTLTLSYFAQLPDRLQYWPEPTRSNQRERFARRPNPFPADPTSEQARLVVGSMHRAGVPLLAGTDAAPPLPRITPGFSLHDELGFFVDVGLTPLEALRTATVNPVRYLRATDSLGTITPGKLADLVVLDADPLADIGNATKIHAVIADGRYFDRSALDALLARVERLAGEGR